MVVNKLKSLIKKNRFARSVTVLAGGTALGQLLVILTSPILTRLYSPEDFGMLAVFGSIFGIFLVVAAFKYELAIPLANKDEEAFDLLFLCIICVFLVSLILTLLLLFMDEILLRWTNSSMLSSYLWLLPIAVFCGGNYQTFNYWAIRKNAFPVLARTKLNQSISSVAVQLSCGFLGFTPIGLLLGQIASQTAGIASLVRLAFQKSVPINFSFSLKRIAAVAAEYRRFPQYSSAAALLNALGLQLPTLLLATFFGLEVTGLYLLTQKLVGVPMTVVASSITQVYIAELTQITRRGSNILLPFYRKTLINIAKIAAILVALIAIIVPSFPYIFGQEWSRASLYTFILLPSFFMRFLSGAVVSSLEILGKNHWRLWRELVVLLLLIGGLFAAKLAFNNDITAIAALSLAGVASYGLTLALVFRAVALEDQKY